MTKKEKILMVIVFIFFVGLGFYGILNKEGLLSVIKLKNEVRRLERENQKLKEENKEIKEKIKHLKNDKEYLEKVIRDYLEMSRENEILLKFIESK